MPHIAFRPGRAEDGEGILAVHLAAIHAVEDAFYDEVNRESWAYGLSAEGYARAMQGGEIFEVAVAPDEIICGFCGVKDDEIMGLYVHPEWQGRGLGKALLKNGEERLTAAGNVELKLTASLNATAFYAANGWRLLGHSLVVSRGGLEQRVADMQKSFADAGRAHD